MQDITNCVFTIPTKPTKQQTENIVQTVICELKNIEFHCKY